MVGKQFWNQSKCSHFIQSTINNLYHLAVPKQYIRQQTIMYFEGAENSFATTLLNDQSHVRLNSLFEHFDEYVTYIQ